MKTVKLFFSTLLLASISLSSSAQTIDFFASIFYTPFSTPKYSDCAAILYKGNLLVDEYSPKGICKIEEDMKGTLTVATIKSSDDGITPFRNIAFKVAIKNDRTNTIWLYSSKAFQEVELEDILKKCEYGDRIILMPVGQRYSLPHHEIEVAWKNRGC